MAFIDFPNPTPVFPVLPPETWSVIKTPSFQSNTSRGISGQGLQIVRSWQPRWEFTLAYGGDESWLRDQTQNITPYAPLAGKTEFAQLCGLFLQCLGSYGEFYYQDPDDNSRTGAVFATTDGVTTSFQGLIPWGNAGFYFNVMGFNTVSAVYLNGSPVSGSSWSIDSSNTYIVFTSAPSSGQTLSADFSFYYRCRFSDDFQDFDQWAENLWRKDGVKFISVKQ